MFSQRRTSVPGVRVPNKEIMVFLLLWDNSNRLSRSWKEPGGERVELGSAKTVSQTMVPLSIGPLAKRHFQGYPFDGNLLPGSGSSFFGFFLLKVY